MSLFVHGVTANTLGPRASQSADTVEANHSRLDLRTYWSTSDVEWLGAMALWANLWSVGLVESWREVGDQVAVATRVYVTSLPNDVMQVAKAVREHWGVDHALQWVLDVSFREGDCRIHIEQGA